LCNIKLEYIFFVSLFFIDLVTKLSSNSRRFITYFMMASQWHTMRYKLRYNIQCVWFSLVLSIR